MALLIILALLSVFLGQPRGMSGITENPVDTIRLARVFLLVGLATVSIVGIFLLKNRNTPLGWGIICMALYSLLAMGSSLYSVVPFLTLWKGFEVLAIALVGMMIAVILKDADDIQHVLNIVYIGLSYLVISSNLGAILNPSEAFVKMQIKGPMAFALQGIYPFINSNTLSQISAILISIALILIVRPEKNFNVIGAILVFISSSGCLLLAHSRTSIFALILAFFMIFFVYRKLMMLLLLFWISIILAISGIILDYIKPYIMRGQKTAVFSTMSGRLDFWPEVIGKIWEAPLFGHGFYASQRTMWNISSVDNTYLEVVLGVGLVGLIILCIALLNIIANLWKTRPWKNNASLNSPLRFIWIQLDSIFIILFIRSLTGPSFQNLHINLILFTILIIGTHRLRILSDSFKLGEQDRKTRIDQNLNYPIANQEKTASKGILHASAT